MHTQNEPVQTARTAQPQGSTGNHREVPSNKGSRGIEQEEIVNDSLGTVNPADSTGVDDSKETGDAKKGNANTRED